MKHYAVIGERLGHSLSVPIHTAFFRLMGIDADYRLEELPRDRFSALTRGLLRELDGFNITIPYKRDVMPLMDTLSEEVRDIGAMNTAVRTPGGWVGHNTDCAGFASMLRAHGMDPAGQPCFVLGTGGASLAVISTLQAMGAASVTVVSRSPRAGQIGYAELGERLCGLLVNCTPAGMFPHAEGCPLSESLLRTALPRVSAVADLIYNPAETRLTAAARALGIPACTGLWMLVAQGMASERLWQGMDVPDGIIPAILKEVRL